MRIERTKMRTLGPTVLPVTLEAARTSLRVDGDALDAMINIWLAGIVSELEHEIGQVLMEQSWEVRQNGFTPRVKLPHPVIAVTEVVYRDQAGNELTLAPTEYRVVRTRYESVLVPASGRNWPQCCNEFDAVTVRLQCGYGATPDSTPDSVKLYILAKLVDQFDPVTQSDRGTRQSQFIDRLLDSCRSQL